LGANDEDYTNKDNGKEGGWQQRAVATLIAAGLMRLPSKKGFAIPPHCLSFDDAGALQF
jgi:hypothetical protein